MDTTWWKKSVVYQIYPKSFLDTNGDGIGDLQGIIYKLDYLKNLGVDVLWLSPIYASPQADNGYDISNYEQIDPIYGSMEDFDRLLEAVHSNDMKLMMDVVVNHTSDEHHWFIESRKSKDSPYRDYYIWKNGIGEEPPTNWGSVFSGSAWEYDKPTEQYYLHLFDKKQPDLNWENPIVRDEVYKMMKFWLEKGVDGFRLDVINFISKNSSYPNGLLAAGQKYADGSAYFLNGPRIHEYLREMNEEVFSKYDMMTVGEMPGASPEDAKAYTNPKYQELQMIFTFEHMNLDCINGDKWQLKPLNLVDLKDNFEKWQTTLFEKGWNSLYWNNHDQPRIVSRFGNDREFREKSAKMLATCLNMMQGTPYIYQGEEIGMTNVQFEKLDDYRDVELLNMYAEKVQQGWTQERIMKAVYAKGRDNARTPFQWSDDAYAGFSKVTPWIPINPRYLEINARAALAKPDSIYYYYQKLIRLRKQVEVITTGTFHLLMKENENVFAYERIGKLETLIVLCNFSKKLINLKGESFINSLEKAKIIISNEKEIDKEIHILRPYEATVYQI